MRHVHRYTVVDPSFIPIPDEVIATAAIVDKHVWAGRRCTRTHRRGTLHSWRHCPGRCHGRTSSTSSRHCTEIRLLHCLSTQYSVHPAVGCLAGYNKRPVLGVVPAGIGCLQVKPELVAAARCQLMKQVVAQPQVASRVVESDFILRPRTVEDVGSVDVLPDQQRKTVDRCRNRQL